VKLAYLNTQYPRLSHTFIEREVRALVEEGFEVHTFSVRSPDPTDTLGDHHARAARETFYLLGSKFRLLTAQIKQLLRRPKDYGKAFWKSQSVSAHGWNARLLAMAYFFEAVLLAEEVTRRGIYHIHVHMANNGAMVALLACTVNPTLRYSMSVHGSAEFFDVFRLNLKVKCESAVFVRCISNFCRAQLMAWTSPETWGRFRIVHCGVDPEQLRPGQRSPADVLRLLTVGRMEPIKGYSLLLEALAQLAAENLAWRLEMVGTGRLEAYLRRQAARLGLTDRIVFSGPLSQEEMSDAYDRNDVLIVSSFMEGVPVVLMEAMAKQLTVISTAVGGVPELIESGVNGFACQPGSVEALTDVIRRVAQGPAFDRTIQQAARRKIVEEFSVANLGREMSALFREYVGT
jgi:glycosyltransferase involved in cell wall biosynthesis